MCVVKILYNQYNYNNYGFSNEIHFPWIAATKLSHPFSKSWKVHVWAGLLLINSCSFLHNCFCCFFISTSEECKASTCSSALEAYNKALLHSLTKLITIFNKIGSHIGALASASKLTWLRVSQGGPWTFPNCFCDINPNFVSCWAIFTWSMGPKT